MKKKPKFLGGVRILGNYSRVCSSKVYFTRLHKSQQLLFVFCLFLFAAAVEVPQVLPELRE